jgi:hypothetical protein
MADTITLEQVEELAAQLPPIDQLKLVAHICEQLSVVLPATSNGEELAQREREAQVDALLAELDAIAESIEGEFDSAQDLRQIREERANRL